MSKMSKIAGLLVAALGGSTMAGCGFWQGWVTEGIVDNRIVDMVLDWLREDIWS
jgi:hypothetical protein